MARGIHVPVLLERCLELLRPALAGPGAVHVDATLGLGGHAEAVLEAFPQVTLVGIDRDPQALALAGDRLAAHAGRTHLVHAVYDELARVLDSLDLAAVDGVLFDLGVSSLQLDEAGRGFAYSQDAPLDMRMDPTRGITAAEVLNTYAAADLARILRVYGEERFAAAHRAAIVRERAKAPFDTSARLVELVRGRDPGAGAAHRGQPREEDVPGAAHRGKRRAGGAGRGGAGGPRRARAGRPDRGAVLPLAGGPPGQAGVRRAGAVAGTGRPAGRTGRFRTDAAAAHPGRGGAGGGRGGGQPAGRLGPPAGGRTDTAARPAAETGQGDAPTGDAARRRAAIAGTGTPKKSRPHHDGRGEQQ